MSPRPESLGYSVYLTSFERQREELEAGSGSGAAVFLFLHISEEFSQDYCRRTTGSTWWGRWKRPGSFWRTASAEEGNLS